MNTQKVHERFWDAMRARFGLRWFTEFGAEPSDAWKSLLNGYGLNELKRALDLMAEQKLEYPPTLPMVEALLRKAASREAMQANAQDFQRNYWRSALVNHCAAVLVQAQVLERFEQFERYLVDHRSTLGESLKMLLDELCEMERRNSGQRTRGIEHHAEEGCAAIMRARLADRRHAA